ncbi:MAG: hypothetical protein R2712_30595 [Vicinamibacterales bacterium]
MEPSRDRPSARRPHDEHVRHLVAQHVLQRVVGVRQGSAREQDDEVLFANRVAGHPRRHPPRPLAAIGRQHDTDRGARPIEAGQSDDVREGCGVEGAHTRARAAARASGASIRRTGAGCAAAGARLPSQPHTARSTTSARMSPFCRRRPLQGNPVPPFKGVEDMRMAASGPWHWLRADPRHGQITTLALLLAYGLGWLAFDVTAAQVLVTVATAIAVQRLADWWADRPPASGARSALISSPRCLLLRTDSLLLAAAAAAALSAPRA